jgi:outer membrane protein OmpA-like peptidoglycan-associated protein
MKKLRLVSIALLIPLFAVSQEKWEGGIFLGYSNYLGDLVEPGFTLDEAHPAFGILIRNHVTPRLGLRLNLDMAKISGDDNNYDRNRSRGASFESSLIELSVVGEYEFLGHKRFSKDGHFKRTFSPYLYGGVGAGFFDPKVEASELRPGSEIEKDINADYSNTHFAIPLGAGLRFDITRKVNLGLELGWRVTFSDYLDGIKLAGDPDDNDIYMMGGLALGFRFGESDADKDGIADEKDKCPTQPGSAALGGCPDSDGDGLADRDDHCPDSPGDIRLNGCPDRDGDGVADKTDDCPDQYGLRRFAGCPDTDNDNIVDKEDDCPTVAGLPALNGCPDADRDGITDTKDKCPNESGTAEHAGCPDSDNDGIADSEDECPKSAGPKKFNGCPDSDNDGISDNKDKCPLLVGPSANDGCPELKPEDKATLDYAMKNVQFETGSSKLLPTSLTILNQVVELMSRYPGYKLDISGYTDNVGNDFANQQLSEKRAQACYDYIVSKGIGASLLSYAGYGENSPIADNKTADGRRQNRRVEFKLTPK